MGRRTFPALNLWEDEQNFYAEAELPGFKTGDVDVSVAGNTLTLQGERKAAEQEGLTYHRRERAFGTFSRVVELPFPVEAEKVKAALKDGVLTITLPKAEAAKPRKIEVRLLEKN
jgi:HSP20 family protein